jgi:hypothetical protein
MTPPRRRSVDSKKGVDSMTREYNKYSIKIDKVLNSIKSLSKIVYYLAIAFASLIK